MKIKTATFQELFNTMWSGLAGQGWKRSIGGQIGDYRYRGSNGLKCAIGHCIDNKTAKEWEGHSIGNANIEYKLNIKPERLKFLTDCQRAHDSGALISESVEQNFRDIAKKYNLTIPGE